MTDAPPRLYLVAPEGADPEALMAPLEAALATGLVACLRLPAGADEAACRAMVNRVMPSCHSADVPLVVTDRPGLVAPLGLDGVHLEMLDESIKKIREAIGSDAIIGATGGTGRHRAMTLAEAGADYVTLGPISPDGSAAEGLAGDDLFSWWAEMIETPVVAEGNVDLATAARLKETADFLVPDPALVWSDPATMLVKFAKAIA